MFTSEKVADVTPRLSFSESDKTRREELEVDLTDQNLGIGWLIPASNIVNSVLLENRVENAKGGDLSGGPADAVVGKLEADGFLHLWDDGRWANSQAPPKQRRFYPGRTSAFPQCTWRTQNFLPCSVFGIGFGGRGPGPAIQKGGCRCQWGQVLYHGRRAISFVLPLSSISALTAGRNPKHK